MVMAQVLPPDGSVVVNGSTVQVTCAATAGDLPITFTWSDPGMVAINPDSSTDTASSTSITPTISSDYGIYTCLANNTFGEAIDVINIIQAGKYYAIFECDWRNDIYMVLIK